MQNAQKPVYHPHRNISLTMLLVSNFFFFMMSSRFVLVALKFDITNVYNPITGGIAESKQYLTSIVDQRTGSYKIIQAVQEPIEHWKVLYVTFPKIV